MKKSHKILIAAAACTTAAFSLAAWGNFSICTSNYTIKSSEIPQAFSGVRIVQVSDFHNSTFGKNNSRLISEIRKCNPDIIVITGDTVDSRRTDIGCALSFVSEAVRLAPVYYVTGNHEARIACFPELEAGLERAGVTLLRDRAVSLTRDGERITLAGIDDPNFIEGYIQGGGFEETIEEKISALDTEGEYFILLSHRPELFDCYVAGAADLVFCGHAHGGQISIPFAGGIFSPGQGLFPEYDSGVFTAKGTSMVVSRGLGNSVFPLRVNNRPELVCVTLENTGGL